ncbi:MAG: hypothetical protein U0325_30125 [Polyangiales bacterium]
MAEETLRALGVVRAVAVRTGDTGPSLLVRAESLTRGAPQAQAMLAVRVLPGAMAPGAQELPPVGTAPRRPRSRWPPRPCARRGGQAAGFSLAGEGPRALRGAVLSVLGCASALLGRRARADA